MAAFGGGGGVWGLDFVCEGGAGDGVIGFTVGVTLGFAGLGVTCCTGRKSNFFRKYIFLKSVKLFYYLIARVYFFGPNIKKVFRQRVCLPFGAAPGGGVVAASLVAVTG